MSADAAYTPGTWVAVGADAGWLLVDIDPTDAIVLKAWSLLRAAAEIDEILDAVLQRGLRAVRSFALVRVSGDARAVVVRGAAEAIISVDGQEAHVTAAEVATWREYPLPANASAVQLRAGAVPGGVDEAPLPAGVTLAATIRVLVSGVPQTARPAAADTPTRPVQPQSSAMPPNGPTSAPARPPAPVPQPPVLAPGPSVSDEQVGPPPPGPPTVPLPQLPPAPPPPDESGPDSLAWLAAARPLGPPAEDSQPYRPPPTGVAGPDAPPLAEPPVWAPPPPGAPDSTVSRAALGATPDQPGPSGNTVQAVRCQHGHLSPPMAVSCRVCGFPLMGQEPVTVPRPTLGVLRLSTGEVVPLDRTVVMGRNPKASASGDGERPHVVRLPSPGHDISRTHVEIRLDGWHVLLTDLNSVNGTVVTPPWQEPQRLRPNEAVPIEPGTVVNLADEVTFRYEVTG